MNHLNREVILASTVRTAFVALLLQKLLSLGIGETQEELDSVGTDDVVAFVEDLLGDVAGFEARAVVSMTTIKSEDTYRANPTSLLTPVFSSRLIFSETTW